MVNVLSVLVMNKPEVFATLCVMMAHRVSNSPHQTFTDPVIITGTICRAWRHTGCQVQGHLIIDVVRNLLVVWVAKSHLMILVQSVL
jgi:hypothetical protein